MQCGIEIPLRTVSTLEPAEPFIRCLHFSGFQSGKILLQRRFGILFDPKGTPRATI